MLRSDWPALSTLSGSVQGHGASPHSGCAEQTARSLCPGFSGWPLNCLLITTGQGQQLHEFPQSCYVTACIMVPAGPRQMADTPCCFAVASAVRLYKKCLRQIRIMRHSAKQYRRFSQNEKQLLNCNNRRHWLEMSPPDVNITSVRISEGSCSELSLIRIEGASELTKQKIILKDKNEKTNGNFNNIGCAD